MAKARVSFLCGECGGVQSRWMGKCPDCGAWDTLEEYREPSQRETAMHDTYAVPSGSTAGGRMTASVVEALPLTEIRGDSPQASARLSTGIAELDRVLGGMNSCGLQPERSLTPKHLGLVAGSTVLVGGDPGIGKSTLLLQAARGWARGGAKTLYVTTEESAWQLKMRAERLGVLDVDDDKRDGAQDTDDTKRDDATDNLMVLAETNLARVVEQVRKTGPAVVIVDSIQMLFKGDLPAAPGSVTQLRTCCQQLVYLSKAAGCAVILVGHVTKRGQLAGPRLLEHMVDAVLYFEGDRYHAHRVIRAIKNRFGDTLEVGLFEMTGQGLREVADGSTLVAREHIARAGSVVCPALQGSRCLLVEIQALTATGFLGSAKRKVSGLDTNRLAMLIAVLEKHGGLRLADQDVFASSVGGMRVAEPAGDLAIALAIAGAHHGRSLGDDKTPVAAFGEVGLGGEVRHVQQAAQRVREAARLGFKRLLCPDAKVQPPAGCEVLTVTSVSQAIEALG